MDKVIYTAMSGAERALEAQQIHANNLANVDTTGFRADLERAQAYQVQGDTLGARVLAQPLDGGLDLSAGPLEKTGRTLDVGVQGQGYFAVETENGEGYTRAGDFTLNEAGVLMLHGSPVQGADGEIVVPEYRSLQIGSDGTISITPAGGGAQQEIGQLKLVNPDASQLTKNSEGLLVLQNGNTAELDPAVKVASGFLESSNVNAIDELIGSMSLTRSFELQVKLMQAADKQAEDGNKLINA